VRLRYESHPAKLPTTRRRHRWCQTVELRFFTGLSEGETAAGLRISISTLKRDWNFAKA
jgi:hypothetical protein